MRIEDFTRLIDAKPSGRNMWKACCPAHDDNRESLSISVGNNGSIVLKCHAGCDTRDILDRMGLRFSDLYPDKDNPDYISYKPAMKRANTVTTSRKPTSSYSFDFNNVVATYTYRNGTRKLRDGNKQFFWQHLEGDGWKPKRGNAPHILYVAGNPQDTLFIVEGEKDCDTMARLGFYAVSPENGAGGKSKWLADYNQDIKGMSVMIIPDNDDVGRDFANSIADSIQAVAKDVRVLDLRAVWPEAKNHQDVSDMVKALGDEEAVKRINYLKSINVPHKARKRPLIAILKDIRPEHDDHYRWTDIGNANLFSDIYKNVARYCPDRGVWYVYDGKVWQPDSKDNTKTMQLCKRLADALMSYSPTTKAEGYTRAVEKWQTRNTRNNILKDAQDCYPVNVADFDKDPYLFNCKNGTLNLRTLEFKPHEPSDLISKMANVDYNPDARCERWEKFIDEVMQGDKDRARYLQRALGYGLTGDTREECFFILYGATSRNGKGTLMESYKHIMGDYGKATSPETIAQKDRTDSSKPSEDVARLAGARFVNISEPDKNLVLSSALIKSLTGNDTIPARFLHEHTFEYKPQFKLFINTNHLPRVTDSTVFSSDRIKVIPFERHFEENERDANLKRLFSEKDNASAILNWCIDGLKAYQKDGLSVPASVQAATKEYMLDSDDITRFMDDELVLDYSSEVRTSEAYDRYREWCERNGFHQKSIKTFSQDLRQRNIDIMSKRPKGGGNPCSVILARKLR